MEVVIRRRHYLITELALLAATVITIVAMVGSLVASAIDILLVSLAVFGGLLLLLPYVWENKDVFHPFGFVGLAYLIKIGGPALDFYRINASEREIMLLGQSHAYLLYPLVLVVLGIVSLLVGYYSSFGDVVAERVKPVPSGWNSRRAKRTVYLFVGIGVISYLTFLYTTGGPPTSLAEISGKRRAPTAYIRWGAMFLLFAALLYYTDYLLAEKSLLSRRALWVYGLVLLGMSFPFLTSNRGTLIWFLVALVVIYHYLRRRVTFAALISLALPSLFLASVMEALRKMAKGISSVELTQYVVPVGVLDTVFGANRGHLTAIAHVVHNTPGELSFKYGQTMVSWTVFPIPRIIWSEKPISIGRIVATNIYGASNGTSPSLIGELYLNFWVPGVIVGMIVFGMVLKFSYRYLIDFHNPNECSAILYSIFAVQVYVFTDINHMMIQLLLWAIPVFGALLYITETDVELIDSRSAIPAGKRS